MQYPTRGVIITSKFTMEGTTLHIEGGFDPVSLRQYLLYWDKIDWPDNNIISIGGDSDSEMQFLQSAGVLERTIINFGSFSGNVGYAMLDMQVAALEARNRASPGAWSLAQNSLLLASTGNGTVNTRAIEVELYSALPVPTADIPFEDILEFKKRRADELHRFRNSMDELYLYVANAADIPRAKLQVISQLHSSLQDLNSVFDETFRSRLLGSLKVELNLPNLVTGALGGAWAASEINMPLQFGAAVGTVLSAIKFDMTQIQRAKAIPDSLRDYAYLHHITRELK